MAAFFYDTGAKTRSAAEIEEQLEFRCAVLLQFEAARSQLVLNARVSVRVAL